MDIKHFLRFILAFSILFSAIQCSDDCVLENRCTVGPIESPCQAAIPRYYYDEGDKKCKEYIWGGCSEITPFATKEECEQQCKCK